MDTFSQFNFIPNLVGRQFDNPYCGCPTRILGEFELIYFIAGKGTVTIKDTTYECYPGDVVLLRPYEEHSMEPDKEEPYYNYFVHFDIKPDYMHKDFIELFFPDSSRKINIGVDQNICDLYSDMIVEAAQKKSGHNKMVQNYFSIIIISLCRMIMAAKSGQHDNTAFRTKINYDSELLDKAEGYIARYYNTKITVEDICRILSISAPYLFKLFQKYLNTSPSKYITQVRLKKAEYLMKNSSYSLKEIAFRTGFSDLYYFSKVFKKVYGMNPREYIKMLKH